MTSTVCTMWSQDTISNPNWNLEFENRDLPPVSFPFWMAKEIALDLSEKEQLESLQELSLKEIALLRTLTAGLEETSRHKSLQITLLETRIKTLEVSLQSASMKKPRDNLMHWLLRMAAALGVGYVLGTLPL